MSNEPLVDIMTLKVGDCVKVPQPTERSYYILKVQLVDEEDGEVMGAVWDDYRKMWGAEKSMTLSSQTKVVKLDMCPDAAAASAGRRRSRRSRRTRRKTRARKSRRYRK